MASIAKDLRHIFRMASRAPGFTAVALLSIALGVAANATVFSVIYGVLLAPSIYKDSDRLVVLWESNNLKGMPRAAVAPATFRDWREGAHAFEGLELVAPGSPVTSSGLPERANIQYATPSLFSLLGIRPAIGRFFLSVRNNPERSRNARNLLRAARSNCRGRNLDSRLARITSGPCGSPSV